MTQSKTIKKIIRKLSKQLIGNVVAEPEIVRAFEAEGISEVAFREPGMVYTCEYRANRVLVFLDKDGRVTGIGNG